MLTLYRDLKEAGISPNITTYRTLINACNQDGLVDEALAVVEDMKQSGEPLQQDMLVQVVTTCKSLGREETATAVIDEIINR